MGTKEIVLIKSNDSKMAWLESQPTGHYLIFRLHSGKEISLTLTASQFNDLTPPAEGESSPKKTEIERRFLISKRSLRHLGSLTRFPSKSILQVFLTYDLESFSALRLRREDDRYYLTVKIGSGLTRTELETEIFDLKLAKELFRQAVGQPIEKMRYILQSDQRELEIDLFYGALEGLAILEIEYTALDEEIRRTPDLSRFGIEIIEEVTQDFRYNNLYLSLFGLPAAEPGKKTG